MLTITRMVAVALLLGATAWPAADASSQPYRPTPQDEETLKAAESAFATGDFPRALALLEPLAERGNPRAQNGVGTIFDRGLGVPTNLAEAFAWYSRSAAQGYPMAQFNLGVMYGKGEGVAKDSREAANWYRKAAEQGHAFAQHNLALMYAMGDGVTQDQAEAFRWELRAAAQCDPNAQYNAGARYATGTGVQRNTGEAFRWFRAAATQGYPLRFDFEPGWTVGYYRADDVAGGRTVAEFVREGDDVRSWKELLTLETLAPPAGRSPEAVLNDMKELRERECPGTTRWNVIAADQASILYEWQATPCFGWPDQHEIARIIHGRQGAFVLHYVVKTYRMPDELRAHWIRTFSEAR